MLRLRLIASGPRLLFRGAQRRVLPSSQFQRHFAKATKEDFEDEFNQEEHDDLMSTRENSMGDIVDNQIDEDFQHLEKQYNAALSRYPDNDAELDKEQVTAQLKELQAELGEQEKILSEDWVLNPANDIYYNPNTQETKVPFEKSWKEYAKRRAARDRVDRVESENKSFPDYLSPSELRSTGQLFPNYQMDIVRAKYNWLDFKSLGKTLEEADSFFFQAPPSRNDIRWGPHMAEERSKNFNQEDWDNENLKFLGQLPHKYHIATMRCVHGTSVGKKHSYGALVVGGNGKGWAGFGYGKGLTPDAAMKRAAHELRKNLTDIPLDEDRTICQSRDGKHGKVKVIMKRCVRGHGMVGGPIMQSICEAVGIRDISTKVIGSARRNPLHVVYAAFKGLVTTISPRRIAMDRGLNYYKEFDAMVREAPPTREQLAVKIKQVQEHMDTAAGEWRRRADLNPSKEEALSDSEAFEKFIAQLEAEFPDEDEEEPTGKDAAVLSA